MILHPPHAHRSKAAFRAHQIVVNYRDGPATRLGLQSCLPDIQRSGDTSNPIMPTEMHDKAHIDVFDRAAREQWALRFGVTEERLRKAVRMVGSRATSVAAYLGQSIR